MPRRWFGARGLLPDPLRAPHGDTRSWQLFDAICRRVVADVVVVDGDRG
jgi:hypothetical protein